MIRPDRTYLEFMTTTQSTLPMNFSNARIELPSMWSTIWIRGERGTVVGTDAETYAEPMVRVLFADSRVGTHKMSEIGRR